MVKSRIYNNSRNGKKSDFGRSYNYKNMFTKGVCVTESKLPKQHWYEPVDITEMNKREMEIHR